MPTRFGERRATRRAEAANTDVMEGEPKAAKTKGAPSLEEHEEAIAKAEADAKAKKDAEPVPLTPSPEPPVLPKWQPTVVPTTPGGDEAKTVGDWIIQGITAIVDEHKLVSLTAWRDPAGNVVVQYVEDPRAMYSLRKA